MKINKFEKDRRSTWDINAEIVSTEFSSFVDWDERFYECPCCGEPVYECDWSLEELDKFICPICEDEDLER